MGLTADLDDRSSSLSVFLADELPDVRGLGKAYRRAVGDQEPILPKPPAGIKPHWSTLASAVELRLLHSFTDQPGGYGAAQVMERVAAQVGAELDDLARECQLSIRSAIVMPAPLEERLCRLCYAVVRLDVRARHGQPQPGGGQPGLRGTVESLLQDVPDYAVHDMAAQAALAETELGALRARCRPESVRTFQAIHYGEVDLLADGTIVDIKATISPRSGGVKRNEFYQLAALALLDDGNRYGVERVGFYLSRVGRLVTWDLEEYLRLLGCRRSVDELRERCAVALGRRLPAHIAPHLTEWQADHAARIAKAVASTAAQGAARKSKALTIPPTEDDIPASIRAIAERSLMKKTALRVTLRDEGLVEPLLKHLRDYGEVRKAGRLTLKTAVHDKLTVVFKATLKKPRTLSKGASPRRVGQ